MFWIGIVIALIGGLILNNLTLNFIQGIIPQLKSRYLNLISLIILIIGLFITITTYLNDQHKMQQLSDDLDLRDFQEVAFYNVLGNNSGSINGMPFTKTPIQDWGRRFVTIRDDTIRCECDSIAINQYKNIIERMPKYPFAYFFLADCLNEKDDPSWEQYAIEAKSILEQTTQVPNHHKHHDITLIEVDKLLFEKNIQ